MLRVPDIRLARPEDARVIAEMSRDCIEHGLEWNWRADRVLSAMRHPSTNVAVLVRRDTVCAFGIMDYGDSDAHLALLATSPLHRHQGLGAQLLRWLEACAVAAGSTRIRLEARADNLSAQAFYAALAYTPTGTVAGYYEGRIDAVRMEKQLGSAHQPWEG